MSEMDKTYLCIDLKSFFASVEAVDRGLNPFKANLVVADPSRGRGAICLAITPAMKKLGIKNRCRIFEIPKNVEFITALPRMKLYMQKSAQIYEIYLRYVSAADIHVYSIDECFIDATTYLKAYNKEGHFYLIDCVEIFKKESEHFASNELFYNNDEHKFYYETDNYQYQYINNCVFPLEEIGDIYMLKDEIYKTYKILLDNYYNEINEKKKKEEERKRKEENIENKIIAEEKKSNDNIEELLDSILKEEKKKKKKKKKKK